ncbi:MAG: TIGR01906 family membrane protein [Aerococcaceae bacterium]|nr:TIGR01906 family membrane protein [Aerococcaceae bacterium]
MGALTKFQQILIALIWGVTCLSLAVTVTIVVSPHIYRICIDWFNLGTVAGLSTEDLMRNYHAVLDYITNPFTIKMLLPHFSSSAGGVQHFYEVKQLILANFVLSGVGVLFSIWLWGRVRKRKSILWLRLSLRVASWFPLVLLFLVVVAFEQLFVLFHQVFFRNDLWLFNPLTDPIITVLPQELFMLLFVCILLMYELFVSMLKWSIRR